MLSAKLRTYFKVLILLFVIFASHHNSFLLAQETSSSTAIIGNKLSSSTLPFYLQDENAQNIPQATTTYNPITQLDSFATVIRILISLTIVIIVAFALSWFLQKRGGVRVGSLGKTIGILPIGNRRFIYMVEIANKVLILGVTDANINLLGEVTDKDTLDALRLENNTTSMPGIEKLFPFLSKSKDSVSSEIIDKDEELSINLANKDFSENKLESKIKNINSNLENRKSKR